MFRVVFSSFSILQKGWIFVALSSYGTERIFETTAQMKAFTDNGKSLFFIIFFYNLRVVLHIPLLQYVFPVLGCVGFFFPL